MGDFRIRYGWAIGPEGTYAANSAATLITPGDTTPDVSDGVLFYTNNTSATAITYFDVVGDGGINGSSQHQGKEITVFFRDGNTTVVNGGQFFLQGTGGAVPANSVMKFLFHNSGWYQTGRVENNQTASVQGLAVGGTDQTLNAAGASLLLLAPSAATTIIGFSGTVPGQVFRVTKNPAAAFTGTAVTIQGSATLFLAGTTAFVMANSAVYEFTTVNSAITVSQAGLASP